MRDEPDITSSLKMGLEYNQYDKLKVDIFNDSVQASMNHIRFQEKVENMLYYFSLAKTSSKLYRSKMNDKRQSSLNYRFESR